MTTVFCTYCNQDREHLVIKDFETKNARFVLVCKKCDKVLLVEVLA